MWETGSKCHEGWPQPLPKPFAALEPAVRQRLPRSGSAMGKPSIVFCFEWEGAGPRMSVPCLGSLLGWTTPKKNFRMHSKMEIYRTFHPTTIIWGNGGYFHPICVVNPLWSFLESKWWHFYQCISIIWLFLADTTNEDKWIPPLPNFKCLKIAKNNNFFVNYTGQVFI